MVQEVSCGTLVSSMTPQNEYYGLGTQPNPGWAAWGGVVKVEGLQKGCGACRVGGYHGHGVLF